jgi:hypothetical protein
MRAGEICRSGNKAVAFKPTQIKSIYNHGTWDGTNPDIMFSKSSREYTEEQQEFKTVGRFGAREKETLRKRFAKVRV